MTDKIISTVLGSNISSEEKLQLIQIIEDCKSYRHQATTLRNVFVAYVMEVLYVGNQTEYVHEVELHHSLLELVSRSDVPISIASNDKGDVSIDTTFAGKPMHLTIDSTLLGIIQASQKSIQLSKPDVVTGKVKVVVNLATDPHEE